MIDDNDTQRSGAILALALAWLVILIGMAVCVWMTVAGWG